MKKKVEKKSNVKIIIIVLIVIAVVSVGVYFIYSKNKSKSKNAENGAAISGYILSDGAEPGLSEDEIRALLQKQVDESYDAVFLHSYFLLVFLQILYLKEKKHLLLWQIQGIMLMI